MGKSAYWPNEYVVYVEQTDPRWKFCIPRRIRFFAHWLWLGYVFFPMSEWSRWKGRPPCRIARLWRRP